MIKRHYMFKIIETQKKSIWIEADNEYEAYKKANQVDLSFEKNLDDYNLDVDLIDIQEVEISDY